MMLTIADDDDDDDDDDVMVVVVSATGGADMEMMRGRITERVGELFQRFIPLGFKLDNLDAPWEYDEEPHVQRRQVRAVYSANYY